MPTAREEQADLPLHVIPGGDTAGARGAAIDAARLVRERSL
jgi:glucokinase